MTSAMTRNQVVAFILSVVLCLFLILAGFNPVTDLLTRWASPAVVDTVAAFSVVTHFDALPARRDRQRATCCSSSR